MLVSGCEKQFVQLSAALGDEPLNQYTDDPGGARERFKYNNLFSLQM